MSELDKIKADLDFYNEVLPLEEELEEARLVKKEDPERWFAAKQAYEVVRTRYREIAEYLKADSIQVGVAEGKAGAISPLGDN